MSDLIERLIRHERLLGQYLNDGSMWCEADEEELGYLMRDMDQWKLLMGLAINALRQPAPPTWTRVEDRQPDKDGWYLVAQDGAINCMAWFAGMWSDWTNPRNPNVFKPTHWQPITPPEGES